MMAAVSAPTPLSTTLDLVHEYAAAAKRLELAAAWSDLRAPVPSCPGWSGYDVVVHVGNVHSWAATIVETGRAAAEQNDEPASSRSRAVAAWYAGKAEDLHQVLREADPDAPCWNFAFGNGTKRFWRRRQLHETTIHQLDLDQANGRATELAPAICRDGVDEVLGVWLHRMHQGGKVAELDRPVALTATDTADTWVVTPGETARSTSERPAGRHARTVPPPPTVRHRATPPTPVVPDGVEAPADVLYRLLWKRVSIEESDVRLLGDVERVRSFLSSRLVP